MVNANVAWHACCQIQTGIEAARAAGVQCELPKTVNIDGWDFHFSIDLNVWLERERRFNATTPETVPAPEASFVETFRRSPRRVQETSPAPTEHAVHGGRIITLRECMDAEETSVTPEFTPPPAHSSPCISGYWFCENCQLCNSDTIHDTSCPTCGGLRPTANR